MYIYTKLTSLNPQVTCNSLKIYLVEIFDWNVTSASNSLLHARMFDHNKLTFERVLHLTFNKRGANFVQCSMSSLEVVRRATLCNVYTNGTSKYHPLSALPLIFDHIKGGAACRRWIFLGKQVVAVVVVTPTRNTHVEGDTYRPLTRFPISRLLPQGSDLPKPFLKSLLVPIATVLSYSMALATISKPICSVLFISTSRSYY